VSEVKLRIGGALVAFAAVLALAGCGNGSAGGAAASGDAQQQYRDCLSRNGVTLPSTRASNFPTTRPTNRPTVRPSNFPTVRPSRSPGAGFPGGGNGTGGRFPQGVDASAFAKAMEACASLRPSGEPGFGNFGGRPGGGNGDGRNAAYRNCLAEHGVTLQDGQQPDASDPKVAAALKTCEVLKPSPSPTN
jgi:hypothetical protein